MNSRPVFRAWVLVAVTSLVTANALSWSPAPLAGVMEWSRTVCASVWLRAWHEREDSDDSSSAEGWPASDQESDEPRS